MINFTSIIKQACIACLSLYFISCYTGKRAAVQTTVKAAKQNLLEESELLKETFKKRDRALGDERIDTTINNRVNMRLQHYIAEMDSINNEIIVLENTLNDRKAFRKNYNDSIATKLAKLEIRKKENELRLKRFRMLNEALDISRQNPFDLAAFFGSGKYTIPPDKYKKAVGMFAPAIDSLIIFSNKYADVPRTSTLVVNGFADGQAIDTSSALYETLLNYLGKSNASRRELNHALSELRAAEISKLMEQLLEKKKTAFANHHTIDFNFYGYGQGETYPSKKISNYREDDERRRIVLVYWSVFPD